MLGAYTVRVFGEASHFFKIYFLKIFFKKYH